MKTPIIINPSLPPITTVLKIKPVEPEPSDTIIAQSILGTPVYSNLVFNADPDTPENTNIELNDVLLNVNQPRNIIVTPIAGRNGTVKEYISDGDYVISVRGVIVSQYKDVYPVEQITALKNLFVLKKAIAVSSLFLLNFEITEVVVQEWNINEIQGSRNMAELDMTMLSDTPIEIQVNA
jgi:hypothetical protein